MNDVRSDLIGALSNTYEGPHVLLLKPPTTICSLTLPLHEHFDMLVTFLIGISSQSTLKKRYLISGMVHTEFEYLLCSGSDFLCPLLFLAGKQTVLQPATVFLIMQC